MTSTVSDALSRAIEACKIADEASEKFAGPLNPLVEKEIDTCTDLIVNEHDPDEINVAIARSIKNIEKMNIVTTPVDVAYFLTSNVMMTTNGARIATESAYSAATSEDKWSEAAKEWMLASNQWTRVAEEWEDYSPEIKNACINAGKACDAVADAIKSSFLKI